MCPMILAGAPGKDAEVLVPAVLLVADIQVDADLQMRDRVYPLDVGRDVLLRPRTIFDEQKDVLTFVVSATTGQSVPGRRLRLGKNP